MNNRPLVSIIIPVYNGSNFLREAINSALAQTYDNIEVIVVNDGSTDDTETIALSYGDAIRYFKKENGGVSSALNLGIKNMKGDYFSWLSHDDKYSPDKVKRQIDCLGNLKNTLSCCETIQINSEGKAIGKSLRGNRNVFVLSWENALKELIKSGCFNGCSLLIPRQAFDDAGLFEESMRFSQDFLMWMKILLLKYDIQFCGGQCVMNRIHERQLTQNGADLFRKDSRTIAEKMIFDLVRSSTSKYHYPYYLCMYFAKYNCTEALKYCIDNAHLTPSQFIKVRLMSFYGIIRPAIKAFYYRFFKGVKIKRKVN